MMHPKLHHAVSVAFTEAAFRTCKERFGAYDICVMWEELVAVAEGLLEVPQADRDQRFREAFAYFGERQGFARVNVLGR